MLAIVSPTKQKNIVQTCRAGKRARDEVAQEFEDLFETLRDKVEQCPDPSAQVSKLLAFIARKNKSEKVMADAANASKETADLPWPKFYMRNKQVGDKFIVYLLVFLGWAEGTVQNLGPRDKRDVFYAIFGDEDVFLPLSLRGKQAENVTWSQAAERFAITVGSGPSLFPKDRSGMKIAWADVPTIGDDVNWDEVGFYKWEVNQRKLSCGNGDIQVILSHTHFVGADASRVHLLNNVAYDTATMGIPGVQSGQLKCNELFSRHGDPKIRLAFLQLTSIMDEKFPKTKKHGGQSCKAAQAVREQPLALLGASATSSSEQAALEDVDDGEIDRGDL
jgi:hypothetical protein